MPGLLIGGSLQNRLPMEAWFHCLCVWVIALMSCFVFLFPHNLVFLPVFFACFFISLFLSVVLSFFSPGPSEGCAAEGRRMPWAQLLVCLLVFFLFVCLFAQLC